jgi:mono/diheme cytochrome c family protein
MIGPPRIGTAAALMLLLSLPFAPVKAGYAQSARNPGSAATATDPTYFGKYHSQPRDTVSAAAYDGFKQFQLNCARCHGDFGVGTSFAPALVESLKPGSTIPTNELFVMTVCAGRPEKGMPGWCGLGLEMDKIQAIYAYLSGRAVGKIGPGRPALGPT